VGCVLAVSVCGEQGRFPTTPSGGGGGGGGGGGTSSDVTPPVVLIVLPAAPHDTVQDITDSLKFTVADTDNVKLKSVQLTVSGLAPYSFTPFIDSANVGVAGYSKTYTLPLKRGAPGHKIIIDAIALDGAGNLAEKRDTIRIVDQKPPVLTMTAPVGSATVGASNAIKVFASAADPSGVLYMGARVFTINNLNQRVVLVANGKAVADSTIYPTAPSNKTDSILVPIPASVPPGTYLLQAFARDSSPTPNDTVSATVSLQVITVLAPDSSFWKTPPQDTTVTAGDSLLAQFDAKDSAGVSSVTFTGYSVHGDSSLGTFTTTPRYTALGATLVAPLKKDTLIRRYFKATPDSSADSVFLSAAATNAGGLTATKRLRIRVVHGRFALVTSPPNASNQPVGAGLTVSVAASTPDSLIALGFYVKRNPAVIRDSLPVNPHLVSANSTILLPAWLRNYGANPQLPLGSVDTIVPFAYGKTSGYFEGPFVTVVNVGAQITITAPATVIAGDSLRVTSVRAQESLLQLGISSITMYVNAIRPTGPCAGCADTVSRYQPIVLNMAASLPVDTTVGPCLLAPVSSDSTAETARLVVEVRDRAGALTRAVVLITILKGPKANVTAPKAGSRQPIGVPLSVTVSASDTSQLTALGFVSHGAVPDSQTFAVAAYSASHTFTLTVPATVGLGAVDTIIPFAVATLHPQFSGRLVVVSFVDTIPPTITRQGPSLVDTVVTAGDSVLVKLRVQDNHGVTAVTLSGVAYRGSATLGTLTTVTRYTPKTIALASKTDTALTRYLNAVLTDSTVEPVYLVYVAQDSAGNLARDSIRIQMGVGSSVRVTSPGAGSRQPLGDTLRVTLSGSSRDSIKVLGYRARGALPGADSTVFGSPLALSQVTTKKLPIPATLALGTDTIVPFATTSSGNQFLGAPVVVGFADTLKPTVTIQQPPKAPVLTVAVGDSVLTRVHVTDNKGVVSLVLTGVAHRGSVSLGTDSIVARYTPRSVTLPQSVDTVVTRYLRAVTPLDSTGEFVRIIATATDSSGNVRADSDSVRVVSGPKVSVVTPAANAVTSPTKSLTIQVHAKGGQGVRILGYRIAGVFTLSDSTIASPVNGVLSDTLTFTKTIVIPALTPLGTFNITAFAVDSTGNPSATIPGVDVTVQSLTATDNVPPLVQFTVPLRVEAGDSINVTATDPSGITKVGFIARDSVGTILVGDSLSFGGSGTFVSQKFRLKLDTVTTFPRVVTVEAFGVDGATTPNRGVSVARTSVTPAGPPTQAFQDTLTLVAGATISLPLGGQFGDAVVNKNRNELYLTNTLLDQIEVFSLTTNSFSTPIRVGSRPLGIALWPRDTLGNNRDTIIVANSGGSNLSIVDVSPGVRAELSRRRLADYIVQTVKTAPTAAGGIQVLTTDYDLSDRPQYLGATCRHMTAPAGVCDSVVAVYSTAPTPAQPGPFTSRGYLASENLSGPIAPSSGHLFYEIAEGGTDTLQIIAVRDTLPGQAIRDTILGAGVGRLVTLSTLALQESTFVRNSGDFNHTVMGEGGFNQGFARALALDARAKVAVVVRPPCNLLSPGGVILGQLSCSYAIDSGVSPGIFVRDFLVNRAAKVLSVATNFNGRTNLVRADSIYAFDYTLKQSGLMAVPSGQSGMDFDPNNAFDANTRTSGGLNKNDRLVFAARPDASIDVFDTYWYSEVAKIPIRDTIIGPIRVASNGVTLILVGVTSRGVVVVRLPNFTNPFPVAPMRPLLTGQPATPRKAVAARP
jgi:hypothetical protein